MRLRRLISWEILIFILLPVIIFGYMAATGDFVALDDELLIIDNPKVHGLTLENVKKIFSSYDPELYVPVSLLTYQIEYSLFGLNPIAYHITSLILHIINVILIFLIFKQLFSRKSALIVSLIFAVHPLNVEAVGWISGRKDVLVAVFMLWSYYLYLRYKSTGKYYWRSVFLFVLGLLSKVSIALFPLVLIATDWSRGERIDKNQIKNKLPYFIASAVFLVIAIFGKRTQVLEFTTPVLISFVSIPFYIQKFFLPFGLSIFYPFTDAVSITHPRILIGIALIAVLIGLVKWSLKYTRLFAFAVIFFLLMIIPSFVNVMKGGEMGISDVYFASDRYAYLAIVGILFFVAPLIRKGAFHFAFLIIAVLAVLSFKQSLIWRNSEALFAHAIDVSSNSYMALNNLGGIRAENGDMEEAMELYKQALEVRENTRSLFNLAQVYKATGQFDLAVPMYQRAIALNPNDAQAHAMLGGILLMQGKVDTAYESLVRAEELNKNMPSVYYNLGLIYEHRGQTKEAQAAFRRVLEIDSGDRQAKKKLD